MKTNTASVSNRFLRWIYRFRQTLISKPFLIEVITLLCILLFVYAGSIKLMDVQKFAVQIGKSSLLTDFANVLAYAVPITELVIAVLLIMPVTRLIGAYAFFGMMVLFTAYITAILGFSDNIPCSCGGVLEKLGWTEHLLFNIGYVGMSGYLAWAVHAKKRNGRAREGLVQ